MNLQPVALRPQQMLRCCYCGQFAPRFGDASRVVLADLDGVPFFDYYHPHCGKLAAADKQRLTSGAETPRL